MSASQSPREDGAGLVWRRVHPVTPLVRGWAVVVAALVVVGGQAADNLPSAAELAGTVDGLWWKAAGALVLVAAIAFGYAALAWRMTSYAVDDDAVHMRKGILFRQQRHARLDRLQAIDVRQPLLARLFGLAELRLEVAGGSDSAVAIGFLTDADAGRLRADLLARAAGIKAARSGAAAPESATPAASDGAVGAAPADGGPAAPGAAAGPPLDDAAPEAPESLVYEVPPSRLLLSLVRLPGVWLAVLLLVGLGVVVAFTRNVGILMSALPAVLGVGGYLFQRFAGEFGFRAALSPDGIRLRHGLLETRAQTIPPGRVQAVSLSQGPWWRGPDWWRVRVNVAGYGGAEGSSDGGSRDVLLPVGPRSEALTAVGLVLPDLQVGPGRDAGDRDEDRDEGEGVDETLALLDEALTGDARTDRWFVTSPRSARLLDPWSWRRNGYAVTGRALLARTGRFVRRLDVVPHERTQSLGLEQGPWQRRRGLASVTLHSTPGPITPTVHHLDTVEAARLLGEQSVRARAARAHARPERWMEGPR